MVKLELETNLETDASRIISKYNNPGLLFVDPTGTMWHKTPNMCLLMKLFGNNNDVISLNEPIAKDWRVYNFPQGVSVFKLVQDRVCLDKYLVKREEPNKVAQIKKWLEEYPFVGHYFVGKNGSHREKRRVAWNKPKTVIYSYSQDGSKPGSLDGYCSEWYTNFIGFHDEYLGFMWLNGNLEEKF